MHLIKQLDIIRSYSKPFFTIMEAITPSAFEQLHQKCAPGISFPTLRAIIKRESTFSPLAININRRGRLERQPKNKQEAIVTAQYLIDNGYNADFGLGQINSNNIRRFGFKLEDVFDPCKNLGMAAHIFSLNYYQALSKYREESKATLAAISMYNTGTMTGGFSNGYVSSVVYEAVRYQKRTTQTPQEKGG